MITFLFSVLATSFVRLVCVQYNLVDSVAIAIYDCTYVLIV